MERKILTIDGGGIKGVFPAAFLAELEETTGKKISDHFDLIVGTSTGGIIALGLGLGIPANEILRFYEKHGPEIFAGNRLLRWIRHLGRVKYDSTALERALESIFENRLLGESKNRLVVPGTNSTGKVHIYKTSHHENFERDYLVKAVDVALGTSAAPTYFRVHKMKDGTHVLDGGVWANNPTGIAVVEALTILGWSRDSISVLSVGCTTQPLDIGWVTKLSLGQLFWAPKVADLFMSSQSFSSHNTAQLLLGDNNINERVIRIDPPVASGQFALDKISEIPALRELGVLTAKEWLPKVSGFFVDPVEQFIPYKSAK